MWDYITKWSEIKQQIKTVPFNDFPLNDVI